MRLILICSNNLMKSLPSHVFQTHVPQSLTRRLTMSSAKSTHPTIYESMGFRSHSSSLNIREKEPNSLSTHAFPNDKYMSNPRFSGLARSGRGSVHGHSSSPTSHSDTKSSSTISSENDDDMQQGWLMMQQEQQKLREGLILESGAFMIPHPDKADKGGEDGFFIAPCQRAIGVADGVGGWAQIGVDAGMYARLLMSVACYAVEVAAASSSTSNSSQLGGAASGEESYMRRFSSGGYGSDAGNGNTSSASPTLCAQDALEFAHGKTNVKGKHLLMHA
ncbi:hypothetical protein CEUSTIGMA_g8420.t1 [Chlamydomonas eustigma]|uniref:Protein phosphatase n=1 Tax=Chlamydomonas eustigma TaxID=1157962 RepID=A0A250XD32_9CHLO|nr:hypothetical protein CEUSTIGMA_g8420.t1 [Chlamydomonas eustigma]|eukprot:GAX80985.1 hypothetical protein CEUSTIGMA_g8420.t1 [Chlamydomonas eustigma]